MKHISIHSIRPFILCCAAVCVLASTSFGDTYKAPPTRQEATVRQLDEPVYITEKVEETYIFNGNEWSIDAFGLYNFPVSDGTYSDGFGGGVGVNYFFNRFVGVGLEGYWWNGMGSFPRLPAT